MYRIYVNVNIPHTNIDIMMYEYVDVLSTLFHDMM